MKNLHKEIKREIFFTMLTSIIGTAILLIVLSVIDKLSFGSVISALFGMIFSEGGFVLMCLAVQKAAQNEDKSARTTGIAVFYMLRMVCFLGFCAIIAFVPFFTWYAAIIPVVFPWVGVVINGVIK